MLLSVQLCFCNQQEGVAMETQDNDRALPATELGMAAAHLYSKYVGPSGVVLCHKASGSWPTAGIRLGCCSYGARSDISVHPSGASPGSKTQRTAPFPDSTHLLLLGRKYNEAGGSARGSPSYKSSLIGAECAWLGSLQTDTIRLLNVLLHRKLKGA